MRPYRKHIGLLLLLVFTSTLGISSATAAHNLHQLLSFGGGHDITQVTNCEAGHLVDHDISIRKSQSSEIVSTDIDDEKGSVIVNNCGTSLQIFTTDSVTLNRPRLRIGTSNIVPLLTSQLYVCSIAEPPRLT
ncbi:MAG: hypothetical protein WD491_10970 [Balneolales bacterium]